MAAATDSLLKVPQTIAVSYLPNHDNISQKALEKGLNIFTQGYIHDIKIFEDETSTKVSAKCFPSMRKMDSPHQIHIDIAISREEICDAYCSCKAGLSGQCSHVVGLIKTLQGLKLHNFTHVPDRQSCTSIPQQWNVPRGNKISPIPINQVIVARPTESRKRKPVVCHVDTNRKMPNIDPDDLKHLQGLEGTPLVYRISNDVPTVSTEFGEVQIGSMLSYQSKNFKEKCPTGTVQLCGDLSVHLTSPVVLPEIYQSLNTSTHCPDPPILELNTREQASCDALFKERSIRLTASNFGKVLNRKAQPNDSFLKSIFQPVNISAKSLNYGKRHENSAKDKYLEKHPSCHLHQCGFVVNNDYSFLGATPDGKICDNGQCGIVEIKCPFTARNLTISEACEQINDFYLKKDDCGNISLKINHAYYAQVQGQLMITGCQFCEFVVYTQQDLFVERILPNMNFMTDMLEKLSVFYRDHAKPFLSNLQLLTS